MVTLKVEKRICVNDELVNVFTLKVDLLSEEQQEVLRNKGSKIERLQSGK
jgi:hypothetical protein